MSENHRLRRNYKIKTSDDTYYTVHSLLALLNRSKEVPFRDFRFACLSQSVQNLSDPNTANTNSFDRINSAARTRSIELKLDKIRPYPLCYLLLAYCSFRVSFRCLCAILLAPVRKKSLCTLLNAAVPLHFIPSSSCCPPLRFDAESLHVFG